MTSDVEMGYGNKEEWGKFSSGLEEKEVRIKFIR